MKKKLLSLLVIALFTICLSGCACEHEWANATCTTPKTCTLCEETEGEVLPHSWSEATCTEPKTCSVCNAIEGEALGHSWKNATCEYPKTCTLCQITDGEKLEHQWVDATFESPKMCSLCKSTEGNALSITEFESELLNLPMYVEYTKHLVQHDQWKSLYPDILAASVKNNSGTSVKNVVVAFVAWDKNGFPIKIHGHIDFSGGSYVQRCKYDDVNLIDGASSDRNYGLAIDAESTGEISTFKVIVVEYTDFDGNTWENPYFDTWCNLYENKVLEQ